MVQTQLFRLGVIYRPDKVTPGYVIDAVFYPEIAELVKYVRDIVMLTSIKIFV